MITSIIIPEKEYTIRQSSRILKKNRCTIYSYISKYYHILQPLKSKNGKHQVILGKNLEAFKKCGLPKLGRPAKGKNI